MAHKKAGGSTDNTRDSNAQRLGVKIFGGQFATPGSIIVRQRGTEYRAGKNVMSGKDRSLFSRIEGIVKFTTRRVKRYDGRLQKTRFVHVVPKDVAEQDAAKK